MSALTIPHRTSPASAVSRDQTRPRLCFGRLVKHADSMWLVCTDSYIAVAIEQPADSGLVEGWVPRAAMRRDVEQVDASKWEARDYEQVVTYEMRGTLGDFPDFAKVNGGLLFDEDAPPKSSTVGLDPKLFAKIGRALGGPLKIETFGAEKPVRVSVPPMAGAWMRRFGLIMPWLVEDTP
ncbi:MAG TPA: hypothetical protein VNJ54_15145 [Plantibacter sp.]|uniref:hypothetical protein n=1 Tax=Plantibacter sp. TaxID=1871045 RepID=UPI002C0B698E|nr:hypothetical protein [Plantibacter sp.]